MLIRSISCRKIPYMVSKYFFSQLRVNSDWRFEQLRDRTVVKVKGEKCSDFLQGLITNDMRLLDSQKAIYGMFLNSKGRVLFDSLIYKTDSEDTFLLECDVNSSENLQKHLNLYKVRKKIEISQEEYSVCAVFKKDDEAKELNLEIGEECILSADPRLSTLGFRALFKNADLIQTADDSEFIYKTHRYRLGIAEGNQELLIGKYFPLEMNCDYLNGVSFNKGCYIGQELTARTHHTGVVRKRLMPLEFTSPPGNETVGEPILETDSSKLKPVGKLIGVFGDCGLGLMRIKETLASSAPLKLGNYHLKFIKPSWWPASEEYERKQN